MLLNVILLWDKTHPFHYSGWFFIHTRYCRKCKQTYVNRFPSSKLDPLRHEKWLALTPPGYKVNSRSRLCSKHFNREQFKIFANLESRTRNILHRTAEPSLSQIQGTPSCAPADASDCSFNASVNASDYSFNESVNASDYSFNESVDASNYSFNESVNASHYSFNESVDASNYSIIESVDPSNCSNVESVDPTNCSIVESVEPTNCSINESTFLVEPSICYSSPDSKDLWTNLLNQQVANSKIQLDLKREKQKNHGLRVKIRGLQKQLRLEREKQFLPDTVSKLAQDLFENVLFNCKKKPRRRRYSKAVKLFAVRASFYSNKSYRYLAKNLYLPSYSTVKSVLQPVHAEPGVMLHQVLAFLQEKIEKGEVAGDCVLLMDEMSTKKQVQVEPGSNKLVGVTTLKEVGRSSNPSGFPASKALFFMLVSLGRKMEISSEIRADHDFQRRGFETDTYGCSHQNL